ncbi:MAG: diaminopimelate decarboxylase [Planctomycetota bacterium]|nr:diaminopimelate decarboxylase [Planctomycetota bacterium]MDA1180668.1 diaminopimelate decarboxylase [Planctomycetota bacterium]
MWQQEIGGVPVRDLAQQFGTPLYVYDEQLILQRIQDLAQFEVVRYAQKACSNIAILRLVQQQGVVVDAVSAGELLRAQAAGFVLGPHDPANKLAKDGSAADPHHQVVYTADIFDSEALDLVAKYGVHCNLGSPDMINQLGERCPGARVTLRINPGFGHGHSQKTNTGGAQSKHGIWHEQVPDCLQRAARFGIKVSGLHMHIGSGTDMEHLSQVCGALEKVATQVGPSLTTISAGGGLPTPYRSDDTRINLDDYFQLWDATRRRLQDQFGHPLLLEVEPGRYLVAESGYLITEIRTIKEMGSNRFYLVDAGFNNLARPILYGAYHPMAIATQEGKAGPANVPTQPVVVGGPLCESGDIFTQTEGGFVQHRDLPVAKVGDWLVIQCAGAYGHAMSSNYNSKPLAAEVLIHQGKPCLIRSRQDLRQIFADEQIPATLLN